MIYIEKLISDPGIFPRHFSGLIDFFASPGDNIVFERSMHSYLGDVLDNLLEESGISIGGRFGTKGISTQELLQCTVDGSDTYFEISAREFYVMPRRTQFMLTQKYNIIVQDYYENGRYFGSSKVSPALTASGSLELTDIIIPVILFLTVFRTIKYNSLNHTIYQNTPNKKLALIPVRKPREHRLQMLHALDQHGLLEDCDWSLVINSSDDIVSGSFAYGEGVDARSKWEGIYDHPFVRKYSHELPRVLDDVEGLEESMHLRTKHHNKYKWYIGCESTVDLISPTEKTFKGFFSGSGVLTVAPKGFNRYMEKFGFQMQGDYDHLDGLERVESIIDIMQTQEPDLDIIRHNHELMTNKEFFCNLIVNELKRVLL